MAVTYRALRQLRGDYGPNGTTKDVAQLEVFTVPDYQAKRMQHLEEKGVLERVVNRPRFITPAFLKLKPKQEKSNGK